jgi:hypothetical protein
MLAGLAADELGKHVLVASFYYREATDAEWRKFWRRFRDHTEKLGDALIGAWVGDLLTDDPPPRVSDFHKTKPQVTSGTERKRVGTKRQFRKQKPWWSCREGPDLEQQVRAFRFPWVELWARKFSDHDGAHGRSGLRGCLMA